MRNFKITVNGVAYNVTVEENTSAQPVSFVNAPAPSSQPVQPVAQPAPATAPVFEKQEAPAPTPAPSSTPGSGDPVKAPMPGTIVKMCVNAGDRVKSGDVLCIIEAMKMENEIVSPKDATVTSVTAAQGASVNAGEILLTIE